MPPVLGDASTLERLIPDAVEDLDVTGRETLQLHLERYAFAARQARPGRLLDLACGVGYGTRLLADSAPGIAEAVGVDLSEEAIRYARSRYGREGVRYEVRDALSFADDRGFDTVVSLETLEHLPDPERLARNLVGALRPEGVLVASAPVTPSTDVNLHHLHDFTAASFRELFGSLGLVEIDRLEQVQPYGLGSVLLRREVRMRDMRPNLLRYYLAHPRSALRRAAATLRFGFTNRYLTVSWKRR